MNSTVVLLLGLLPVSVFVLWPLFTGDDGVEPRLPENELDGLERQKLNAYSALKEVEFDQRTGKLSPEDYDKLVERYKGQALAAMVALEQQGGRDVPEVRTDGKKKAKFCPACGDRTSSGAKFCAGCGKALPQG